jgi:hypothetical protein
VFSVKSFKSTPAAGTESLSPDDAAIHEKLQSEGTLEAKVWLEKDEQRLLGRYNQKQAQAKIDEMYRAGAAKVSILPGRFVMSVVVELPTKPDLRKRFFDWQQEHHGAIGETVTFDTGQKYIYVTMPR